MQVEFRSLHVAEEMWDWVQSPYRQDLCVELIACLVVSQPSKQDVAAQAHAVESIRLPCYEMVKFDDVRQLQVDPKALQYFKPYSCQYPAVDSFTSDGRLYIATRGEEHSVGATIVRTLQVLPEQLTPELVWVMGTKEALSGFPASAMPFSDKLNAARLAEDYPDEPSAEFWTSTSLEWRQVPRKARHLLAKLQQYVMWLDYTRYKE